MTTKKKRIKLSTAIRRGAKLPFVVGQTKNEYTMPAKEQGKILACALGAAYLALHPEQHEIVQRERFAAFVGDLTTRLSFGLQKAVVDMNDRQGLSFNQIAYRLERDPELENPYVEVEE